MAIESRRAIDRVDDRQHAVEPKTQKEIRMAHQRVQDRRRIGQTRRFDQEPVKRRNAAVIETAQKILQGVDEVAAQGAAKAT